MRIPIGVLAICLLAATAPIHADSFVRLNTAQLLRHADWAVHGQATVKDNVTTIRVIEVLDGDAPMGKITTRNFVKLTQVFADQAQGIFFLRKYGDEMIPFNPSCYLAESELPTVRQLLALRKDPAPLIDLIKHPENENFVFELGELFAGFHATCPEYPFLASAGSYRPYYLDVPWGAKDRVEFSGKLDAEKKLVIKMTAGDPDSALARYYREALDQYATPVNAVHEPFTLTVDARIPQRVGTLTSDKALSYLRDRLESPDPQIVMQAIIALAKARDLDSLAKVQRLAESEDRNTRYYAKLFLAGALDDK